MDSRRSTLRTSVPAGEDSARFSTLITRSPVYSRAIFAAVVSAPRVSAVEPPITPSTSKGLPTPSIGSAFRRTLEPPSSKLDW